MNEDSLLGQLAEEFTRRVREGKLPDIEEYAKRYPELSGRIRELFPTLMLLEGMAGDSNSSIAEATPSPLSAGSIFGNYRIEREIGRGGMGIVYEAIHALLEKRVALKVLPVQTVADAGHLERFFREAKIAAGLHHTNIVPVFDVGQFAGTPYFAMQYIEGSGLNRILSAIQSAAEQKSSPTAPPDSALETASEMRAFSEKEAVSSETRSGTVRSSMEASKRIAAGLPARLEDYFRWVSGIGIQAAEGLTYAHERKIIHRDIKPSNLLLDKQGVLWIADFGLARKIEDPAMTHSGEVLGTPRYMSPEQAKAAARPIDHRSDIYSLGVTLYELLTCRPVFEGKTPLEVLSQIITREPVPPRRLNPEIPADLAIVVMKAMAKRPEDRYQSARELADDLARWQNMEPIKARAIGPLGRAIRWRRRNPRVAAVTTTAAVIILALSGIYYARLITENAKTREALKKETQARSQVVAALNQAELARNKETQARSQAVAALNQAESARRESRNSELRAQAAKNQAVDARKTAEMERDSARTAKDLESAALKREKQQSYTANLLAADLQLRSGFPRIAQQYLLRCDLSLRGWEWDYLFLKADTSITTIYMPEVMSLQARYSPWSFLPYPATLFSFSPDGEHIYWNSEIAFFNWNERTRALSVTIVGTGSIRDVSSIRAVSSGGSMILTSNPWRVIETATGRVISKLDFSNDEIYSAAIPDEKLYWAVFSTDGAHIAVTIPIQEGIGMEVKEVIYLIDTASGKSIHRISVDEESPSIGSFPVAFSLDGTRLASGSFDGNTVLWDVKSGNRIRTLKSGDPNQRTSLITAFAYGCNDRRLAAGYGDGYIEVWNPSSGDFQFSMKGQDNIHALAFNSDCSQLTSVGNDIQVWDTKWRIQGEAAGREIAVLSSGISLIPPDSIAESANFLYNSVAFSPEGDRLFAGTNNHVKVWDTNHYQEVETLQGGDLLTDLVFSPDGSTIAAGSLSGFVTAWDLISGKEISRIQGHRRSIQSLSFSPDGTRIATASEDKTAKIWDIRSGQERMTFIGHEKGIFSVCFSPDGDRLATGSSDGTARIWDVKSGKQISILRHEGRDFTSVFVDFSPDGRKIATSFSGTYNPGVDPVQIWDVNSGAKLLSLSIPRSSAVIEFMAIMNKTSFHFQSVGHVHYSPDGKRIALSLPDLNTIEIWDSSLGDHLATLRGYLPGNFTFSPDGRRIVSTTSRTIAGVNDFFAIWDTFSSDLLLKVSSAESGITAIKAVFSPDGSRIASIASDDKVRIWNSRSVYVNIQDSNFSQTKDAKDPSRTVKIEWNWPSVFPLKSDR